MFFLYSMYAQYYSAEFVYSFITKFVKKWPFDPVVNYLLGRSYIKLLVDYLVMTWLLGSSSYTISWNHSCCQSDFLWLLSNTIWTVSEEFCLWRISFSLCGHCRCWPLLWSSVGVTCGHFRLLDTACWPRWPRDRPRQRSRGNCCSSRTSSSGEWPHSDHTDWPHIDHTEWPHRVTTQSDHTEWPHWVTTQSDHTVITQSDHTEWPHKVTTQWSHRVTTLTDHTEWPHWGTIQSAHTVTTHNDHTVTTLSSHTVTIQSDLTEWPHGDHTVTIQTDHTVTNQTDHIVQSILLSCLLSFSLYIQVVSECLLLTKP